MNKIKIWISAFRLKTLPLSVSGVVVASMIAKSEENFDSIIFSLAVLTTLFLQILSNLANDYGDGVKGTDENRLGSRRAVQSGDISKENMKLAVIVFAVLSFISGLLLVYKSFYAYNLIAVFTFIVLGIAAIAAAIKYTMGDNPYGYSGFGDVFVYIFFGLISVFGTYFLFTKSFDWEMLLVANSIGMLSVGVLNLNNLRDYVNDKRAGKNTLVVRMGVGNAKLYHEILIVLAVSTGIIYNALNYTSIIQALFLIVIFPLFSHVKRVTNNTEPRELEPELKKLALTTLLFAFLLGLGMILANNEYLQFY